MLHQHLRTSFQLAVTSSNQFLPVVCACQVNSVAWACRVTSDFGTLNNADVLLNSGLNLFDIMANLCSKLCCEVLLKSWNYIVYLLKWISTLDFKQERLCKTDLSGPKALC